MTLTKGEVTNAAVGLPTRAPVWVYLPDGTRCGVTAAEPVIDSETMPDGTRVIVASCLRLRVAPIGGDHARAGE